MIIVLVFLLPGLSGKCLESCGQTHQAHDFILQSISTMFSRNAFYHSYSSSLVLLDLIEKEFTGDVFTIERATLLYNICLLSLKGYHSKNIRYFNVTSGWLLYIVLYLSYYYFQAKLYTGFSFSLNQRIIILNNLEGTKIFWI